MIRINLLPIKKARKREAGVRQLAYMGGGIFITVAVVFFVYIQTSSDLDTMRDDNRRLSEDIERFKQEIGDYDKIRAQREELLKQQKTIQSLQKARTGPVFVLRELSEILTPGKGPTFDRLSMEEALRREPTAGFNATWDTKRVWIEDFSEEGKRVKLKGGAKSNEDVAEFLKRLSTSVFFADVAVEGTQQVSSGGSSGVKYLNFSLSAGVNY